MNTVTPKFMILAAVVAIGLALSQTASAENVSSALRVTLAPAPDNPAHPRMGDKMKFISEMTNTGNTPIKGSVAWISLVQVDKGQEQPVDLEDWSAHKADVIANLAPGESHSTAWPMRLIKNGDYRVVISAASGDANGLIASPMLAFQVAAKPVVESVRVLPIALGIPLLLMLVLLFRQRRSRTA